MKTLESLQEKRDKLADNRILVTSHIPNINYLIRYPFKNIFQYNALYWFFCSLLIPNTNLIGSITKYERDGTIEPLLRPTLRAMTAMNKHSFESRMSVLVSEGIIFSMKAGRFMVFYMNPYFAVAGDSVPKFLFDLAEVEGGRVVGQHLFPKDNELYKENRNEGQMFGDFKKRVKSKYFITALGG